VVARAHRHGARVLVNGDVALAQAVGADARAPAERQLLQRAVAPG